MSINLKDRHFLSLFDYNKDEITYLLNKALELKQAKNDGSENQMLKGKNIALIFEKDSTRTRCAFEVAAYDQGAHITYIGTSGSQIGKKESMKDTARVLGRMYDGILYRGYEQSKIVELAFNAGVPVWNGLTDEFHPTQVLADFLTIIEHSKKPLNQSVLVYLGDGRNNMANSLMIGAAIMGMDVRIVGPDTLQPQSYIIDKCRELAKTSGAKILITSNVEVGLKNADFVYTDVWVSMGEDDAVWKQRVNLLKNFQVNRKTMSYTAKETTKFMHCLPAFHNRETEIGETIFQKFGLDGLEVTTDVFESDASVVFDQAENRLHTIKSVMVATLIG